MDDINSFKIPEQLQEVLDTAYQNNQKFKLCLDSENICKCPADLPCFVKPFNINRLNNYTYIKKIIKQKNLDQVILPQKFLWQNKSTLRTHVVAEELKPKRNNSKCTLENISIHQFLQIVILGQNGVWDFKGGNNTFSCTNIFLTESLNSDKFWETQTQAKSKDSTKIAFIDTKRIFENISNRDLPSDLTGMFGSRYQQCVRNTQFRNEFENLPPNPTTLSVKEFWAKWESCFKA